ncbi:DNA replication protein DnaC [compost metagenome]
MALKPFTMHAGLCPIHPQEEAGSHDGGITLAHCMTCSREKQEADYKVQQQEASDARRAKEVMDRVEACRIPIRFIGKKFSGYLAISSGQKANLEKCEGYARDFDNHYADGRCLILSGTVGTGKTHLATAILRKVVEEMGYTGKYWTVNGLLQVIRSSYEKDSDYTEYEVMQSVINAELLVLDEVGATKQSEFELATLFNIINSRYERQIPTIVISNLGPKQICEALGERCFDRLREGGGECLIFQGESNRKQK